jgi:hypothetical protein
LVSDIPAGGRKTAHLFYSVGGFFVLHKLKLHQPIGRKDWAEKEFGLASASRYPKSLILNFESGHNLKHKLQNLKIKQ